MEQLITFEPWPDRSTDFDGLDPSGTYSRLAWLPTLGPSGWLIWGTVAAQFQREPEVTWDLADLAQAHGLGRNVSKHARIVRSFKRLAQFRLILPLAPDRHLARLSAPPVPRHHLSRLPPFVAEVHRQTFDDLTPPVVTA